MAYSIEIEKPAEKAIRALDKPVRRQVLADIAALAEEPRPMGYVQLKGSGDYRIVSGKAYRIIYSIKDNEKIVIILLVGHRSSIYKQHKRR